MINFLMNQRETYFVNVNINKEVNLHVMNIIFKTLFYVPLAVHLVLKTAALIFRFYLQFLPYDVDFVF